MRSTSEVVTVEDVRKARGGEQESSKIGEVSPLWEGIVQETFRMAWF
jgi:hypothetical protein